MKILYSTSWHIWTSMNLIFQYCTTVNTARYLPFNHISLWWREWDRHHCPKYNSKNVEYQMNHKKQKGRKLQIIQVNSIKNWSGHYGLVLGLGKPWKILSACTTISQSKWVPNWAVLELGRLFCMWFNPFPSYSLSTKMTASI